MLPPRGYIFIGLNILRLLSVVALVLVFSSSILGIVHDVQSVNKFRNPDPASESAKNSTVARFKSTEYILNSQVPNQPAGEFWAIVNRLLIIGQIIVLFISEVGVFTPFFDKFFPVLGKSFGLGAIGLFQCFIGAAVLSHHVDAFALVSAWFLFAIGCINILAGLIWRERSRSKRSITSWRDMKKSDVLPKNLRDLKTTYQGVMAPSPPPSFHSHSNSVADEKSGFSLDADTAPAAKFSGFGFGRQGEKAAAAKGFLISKPLESLPRYMPKT